MKLIPGLVARKLEALPEYFFLDYPHDLKEVMTEIYFNTKTLINLVRIEGNSDLEFDPYRLIDVLRNENEIQSRALEFYIEVAELVDPSFAELPNFNNRLGNIVISELFKLYRRFLDLDLYIQGELPYEFFQECENGFLLKRKERLEKTIP